MKLFVGALVLTFAVMLQFAGCRKNTLESDMSDDQYFYSVVSGGDASTSDLANSELDALKDGQTYSVAQKAVPPSIQSALTGNPIVPSKWGSIVETVSRTITNTFNVGDTVTKVDVKIELIGHFVIIGTINGVADSVKKPFTETLHRSFRFVRVANTRNARLNWRLDGVSVLTGSTANSQITINQIQALTTTGNSLTVTDPDNYYLQISHWWMHPLPQWNESTTVTVSATIHSTDPDSDLVVLHYLPRAAEVHRVQMGLVTTTPNPAGGFDRVYSHTVVVPATGRRYGSFVVSAATSESLYSADSTKFSLVLWGVPYKTAE